MVAVLTRSTPNGVGGLLTIPSGITAAPSNLACRFVAIRGKFVQIGLEGHLGAYLGGLHVHVEA